MLVIQYRILTISKLKGVNYMITKIKSVLNKIERERERLNLEDKKIIDRELRAIYDGLVCTYNTADYIVKHY